MDFLLLRFVKKGVFNKGGSESCVCCTRYPYQLEHVETFVMDIVRDQLAKRQLMDTSAKSLIRLMTATCGYAEVRALAAQKLELWLQNPKV